MTVATKSVSEPIDTRRDGLRILATRFRGRRLPKAAYDVWMANLAPSDPLLEDFLADKLSWRAFRTRYRREMMQGLGYGEPNRKLRNSGQKFTLRLLHRVAEDRRITLLCHCAPEDAQCHRYLLKELIESVCV